MYRFTIRVRIGGNSQDLSFQALSYRQAEQQVEAIYGAGSVLGCINEEWINP